MLCPHQQWILEDTLGLILRSLKRQVGLGDGEERGRGTSLTSMASLITRTH